MEKLVLQFQNEIEFRNALNEISLSESGKRDIAEALVGITEDYMRGYGFDDKYLWLYSLPFIHFFGGKQTALWVPNSLENRQFNIASEKMIHLLRIDPYFSHAFLRCAEFPFLAKRIVDNSDFIYNIDFLMLLEKMMTENKYDAWRNVDSVKLSSALQELVKLNLDKYQEKDWNHVVQLALKRWGPGPFFNEHERNLSQVLLIIVPRYV